MTEARTQVALVGFSGTGKTTIGKLLAQQLSYDFIDLDDLIAVESGISITEIFADEGEEGFRLRERELLSRVAGRDRQVLSTGGGIVMDPRNVRLLRSTGLVVALEAELPVVLARVGKDSGRPLLDGADPAAAAGRLMASRAVFYERAAHFKLNTSALTPGEAAGIIARWCRESGRKVLDD